MNYEVAVAYERCYHGIWLLELSKTLNPIAVMIAYVPTETQRGISRLPDCSVTVGPTEYFVKIIFDRLALKYFWGKSDLCVPLAI